MQKQLDTIVLQLKLEGFNQIPLLQKICTPVPNLQPAYLAFGFLIFSIFFCLINVGSKFLINLIGLAVPAYLSILGIERGHPDIGFLLPYFLIFSTMVVFDNVLQYILSFLPAYHVINLVLVVALFHPDIRLAKVIWGQIDSLMCAKGEQPKE